MSRQIFDSEQVLGETVVSLAEACKCFPVKCSRSTLERFLRRGAKGVLLESVLIGGRRFTSKEAIDRFIRCQLHTEPDRPGPKFGAMSKREIAEASRKFGLPEPQGSN